MHRISSFLLLTVLATPLAFADPTGPEALEIVATSSNTYERAMAIDVLGRLGGDEAVAAIAPLLADEKLHDYARDALARIPGEAAEQALLRSLGTLEGDARIGVIITLGETGSTLAVQPLGRLAAAADEATSHAAVMALGHIADDQALGLLVRMLHHEKACHREAAAHALLLAAQQLDDTDRAQTAKRLRLAIGKAEVPARLKRLAGRE